MLTKQMQERIDSVFPFRDSEGNPQFRTGQRDVIVKILEAFLVKGKKFVGVEGPVGCGKSVINYVVARCVGHTKYLTSLVNLQDQIDAERWDEVRTLKGRRNYTCNHCGYNSNYKCDYDGPDKATCLNHMPKYETKKDTWSLLKSQIGHVNSKYNGLGLRQRTSFQGMSEHELDEFYTKAAKFLLDKKIDWAEKNGVLNPTYNFDVENKVCCTMSPVECPSKSSKLVAMMNGVNVYTPDMYYNMRMGGMTYPESFKTLMVIDECQATESVIQRIFKAELPIGMMEDLYGMDMSKYKTKDPKELFDVAFNHVTGELNTLYIALGMLKDLKTIMGVKSFNTLITVTSKSELSEAFQRIVGPTILDLDKDISPLDIMSYVFSGKKPDSDMAKFDKFISLARNNFVKKCKMNNVNDTVNIDKLIQFQRKTFGGKKLSDAIKKKTKKLKENNRFSASMGNDLLCDDIVHATTIIDLENLIKACVNSFGYMAKQSTIEKDGEKEDVSKVYLIDNDNSIKRKDYLYKNRLDKIFPSETTSVRNDKVINFIPVDIGWFMNKYFYRNMNHILLTSGTWVYYENAAKAYGIDTNDWEFIKMPSTFKPGKRPVYVMDDNSVISFSAKNNSGEYIYKTPEGIKLVSKTLNNTINGLRKYTKDKAGKNANILVHCHSFTLAKLIAENYIGDTNKLLIYLSNRESHIRSTVSDKIITTLPKSDVVDTIMNNPDSGYTILATSLSEGLDFKYDIVRHQIILKNPTPSLGDPYINVKNNGSVVYNIRRDPTFYNSKVFTTLIQQYGRVMRAEDDWGFTVMFDKSISANIKRFIKMPANVLDKWNVGYLLDGVRYSKSGNVIKFAELPYK